MILYIDHSVWANHTVHIFVVFPTAHNQLCDWAYFDYTCSIIIYALASQTFIHLWVCICFLCSIRTNQILASVVMSVPRATLLVCQLLLDLKKVQMLSQFHNGNSKLGILKLYQIFMPFCPLFGCHFVYVLYVLCSTVYRTHLTDHMQ